MLANDLLRLTAIRLAATSSRSTLLLSVTSIILGFGFWFGDTSSANYTMLHLLANDFSWGALFVIYGLAKLFQDNENVPAIGMAVVMLLGVWLWMCIAMSFVFIDPNPTRPTEPLLLLPGLLEAWYLADFVLQRRWRFKK